jgi:hypothetical protein
MSHRDPLELVARAGYAARGVVYLLIGGFALAAAMGLSGASDATRSARSVLASLIDAPAGRLTLACIALGLIGYSGWRATQAVANPDEHPADAKGYAIRAALAISAFVHTGLAAYAGRLAWTAGGAGVEDGGDVSKQSLASELLSQPWGRWLVGAVALAIAGAGIAHLVKGWSAGFLEYFEGAPRWTVDVCRFGLAARGVVFLIVGGFFLDAAIDADPTRAGGMEGALDLLRGVGTPAFSVIAVGLVAFGCYSLIEALYRRVGAAPTLAIASSPRPPLP